MSGKLPGRSASRRLAGNARLLTACSVVTAVTALALMVVANTDGISADGIAGSDGVPSAAIASLVAPTAQAGASATSGAGGGGGAGFPDGIDPERIRIPAIGVDAFVGDLDISGPVPEVPEDFAAAGWYTQTRLPGEIGPTVIAGHVDSRTGPAVFYALDQLVAGDELVVESTEGEIRRFVVRSRASYPKESLPPEVFGFGEPVPQLRLITCGGSFDSGTGHYEENVVVYAEEASG